MDDYIEMVLSEFLEWLHYSEIRKQINEKYKINVDDRYVHNTLWHFSWIKFINIWLWIYTLKSNIKYSWEKTWDLVYIFLKNDWFPKTLKEITDYVLSRKKINKLTVLASITWYKNENRFVYYNDWKIGLKEWGLWNVRKKREMIKYKLSLYNAYVDLLNRNMIPDNFYLEDIKKILEDNFWNDVSTNAWGIWFLIKKEVEKWKIKIQKTKFKNIYSLIK
jgi:hypothetical protein